MTAAASPDLTPAPDRFDYFMVRLARWEREPGRIAGLVERMATGEKCSFVTADELLRLVAAWSGSPSNMQIADR